VAFDNFMMSAFSEFFGRDWSLALAHDEIVKIVLVTEGCGRKSNALTLARIASSGRNDFILINGRDST